MGKIVVTGGAGYIGSHTVLALIEKGYDVTVIDNLSNSSIESIKRVEKLTGKTVDFQDIDLANLDVLDACDLHEIQNVDSVIHFAAYKAVGESVTNPLKYYSNNLISTMNLLQWMKTKGCNEIVFSSSATVYGDAKRCPVTEKAPTGPTNPYGHTKLMNEQILMDYVKSNPDFNVTLLRYFNPVGAHPSGEIGEDPKYPNNLMPYVQQVAAGIRPELTIFGDDYPTPDGSGIRDYIHVMDLAEAHVAAIENMNGCQTFNIGTGKGYSVKEVVKAFETISGKSIPVKIGPRREGDVAILTANANKAKKVLKWKAKYGLDEMVRDSWNWQSKNPKGYN